MFMLMLCEIRGLFDPVRFVSLSVRSAWRLIGAYAGWAMNAESAATGVACVAVECDSRGGVCSAADAGAWWTWPRHGIAHGGEGVTGQLHYLFLLMSPRWRLGVMTVVYAGVICAFWALAFVIPGVSQSPWLWLFSFEDYVARVGYIGAVSYANTLALSVRAEFACRCNNQCHPWWIQFD
jgi:hypothetical protein